MSARLITAVIVTLATGTAIALQALLIGRAAGVVGPVRAGLLANAAGGTVAALILTTLALSGRFLPPTSSGFTSAVGLAVLGGGILGIVIVAGIAFSVQSLGVTAGLAGVILSQLVVGLLLDQSGAAGAASIALDPRRLLGIVAMGIGVWLLVPRAG